MPKFLPHCSTKAVQVKVKLCENIWFRVAAYLYTHELLVKIGGLSAEHLAMLGEEGCWSTLALPVGSRRLRGMLSIMLVEARTFWVPMLHHVQTVELDMRSANSRTVDLLRDLLLRGLAVDGVLNSISIRNVPVFPEQDEETASQQQLPYFSKKDLRLVNPITTRQRPKYALFLLDPCELGRLRFLMANFRYFRISRSADLEGAAVDLVARHMPPPLVMDVLDEAASQQGGVCVKNLAEAELHDLRRFEWWDEGCFHDRTWFRAIESRYAMLLASWS